MLLISIVKWKVVWDNYLASARNVDITAFLGLLFCLEWKSTRDFARDSLLQFLVQNE